MMGLLVLLPVFILLNGCVSRSDGKPEAGSLYAERLGRPLTERRLECKELILALCESRESSLETSRLRTVLEKNRIKLKIIRISDRNALSAMVRSGRADLIAGAFSPEEIRSLHLLPVLPYTGMDGKSQFCLAVRYDDHILEKLLDAAAASGNTAGKE